MTTEKTSRELIMTGEFLNYYNSQPFDIQKKFDYVMNILRTERVPSTKFIKKLVSSDFYEMRVSVGSNEYRSILLAIDDNNIINAIQILMVCVFLKKSEKDYKRNIELAYHIINKLEEQ